MRRTRFVAVFARLLHHRWYSALVLLGTPRAPAVADVRVSSVRVRAHGRLQQAPSRPFWAVLTHRVTRISGARVGFCTRGAPPLPLALLPGPVVGSLDPTVLTPGVNRSAGQGRESATTSPQAAHGKIS